MQLSIVNTHYNMILYKVGSYIRGDVWLTFLLSLNLNFFYNAAYLVHNETHGPQNYQITCYDIHIKWEMLGCRDHKHLCVIEPSNSTRQMSKHESKTRAGGECFGQVFGHL